MTTQVDLEKVWAVTGGAIDPDIATPGKYENGWVVEIPTYENFNWVLQTHSKNILALAEQGEFTWQADIAYSEGTRVIRSGINYMCRAGNTNQDPTLDVTNTYWAMGAHYGPEALSNTLGSHGVRISHVQPQTNPVFWEGNALTLVNEHCLIQLETTNPTIKNWLIGNAAGDLVAIDIGFDNAPDNRGIWSGSAGTHKIYHQGFKPTQSDVSGTIPDAPVDGGLYGRFNANWIKVTTTAVTSEPPPPITGTGTGWYNLGDGQLYVDIDDGDSSQWVPANSPVIPTAENTPYDNTTSGLLATTVQAAIDELAAKHP